MENKNNDSLARIAIFRGFQVDGVLMLKNPRSTLKEKTTF